MKASIFLLAAFAISAAAASAAQPLELLISAENTTVAAPSPLRLTIHFLNAGKKTLWLYRPLRDFRQMGGLRSSTPDVEQAAPQPTYGGSTLQVHLVSAEAAQGAASAMAFSPVEMPHPTLIRLEPGGDAEEHVMVHVAPALAAGGKKAPVWGKYKLSVIYRARYSNGEEIERNLGVDLWHAEAESNTLQIWLQPGGGRGEVTGTVADPDAESTPGILVSLSDIDERLIDQTLSDSDGQFRFEGLPWGLYWVTVRGPGSGEATAVFQHVLLGPASPSATADLMLLPESPYKPKQVLHKPVLVQVVEEDGRPAADAALGNVFSNGAVVENVKAKTGADGVASLNLMPGSNFLTIRARGCTEEERRMDVSSGAGVDGFRFQISCHKKK